MKPDPFSLLLQSATEMRAIRRGTRKPARTRRVTAESAQVVRTRLGLSQPAFADLLGILVAARGATPLTWGASLDLAHPGLARTRYIAALQSADQNDYTPLLIFANS